MITSNKHGPLKWARGRSRCRIPGSAGAVFLLGLLTVPALTGCFTTFSELQDARLIGPGKIEITPHCSMVSGVSKSGNHPYSNQYGLQFALGAGASTDMRFRIERIDFKGMGSHGLTVFGFGPKFSLKKNRLAALLPIGFAFGKNIKILCTTQVHPGVVSTIPLGDRVDLNLSAKAIIPVTHPDNMMLAVNLGPGIRVMKPGLVLRPETGLLWRPGAASALLHLSLGVSFGTN